MIPSIIHFVWLDPDGGQQPMPADVERNVETWSALHPDFEIRVWSLAELGGILTDFHGLPVLQSMEACSFPATKSNLARLALMYEYGGFYSDLKNVPLRPFLYDLQHSDAAILTEHPPTERGYRRTVFNAFLGSKPGHELWINALRKAIRNVHRRICRA